MQKTEELFHKWNADRRPDTFESRLLANRLKARFRCPLHLAYQSMSTLGADDTLEKLIYDLKTKIAGSSKQIEPMSVIARRSRSKENSDPAEVKGKKSVDLATWLQAPHESPEAGS